MILADTLKALSTKKAPELEQILRASGYKTTKFKTSKFVGLTNSGDFCYSVSFYDEVLGEDTKGKVYIQYDVATGFVQGEF